MVYKYGIDFGTTNSSIAIRFAGDDKEEHTLVVNVKDTLPREIIPSVVLATSNGDILAGADAKDRYERIDIKSSNAIFVRKIKMSLEEYGSGLKYRINNKEIQGVDLIAAILRVLRLKAEKEAKLLELNMSGVVMGVPVDYGDIQKNVLKEALYKAGFYKSLEEANKLTEFVSEPLAVAVHYGLNLQHDKTVLVFDFGGGTLDIAIVNLKNQVSIDKLHPHKTIAKERITLGGEELTKQFFINSFCNKSKYGTSKISQMFGFDKGLTPEQLWNQLTDPTNNRDREDRMRFIDKVEECKCDLSIASKYRFSFIGTNKQLPSMTFYRDDFVNAIDEQLDKIQKLIDDCLEAGNITDPFDIDRVILAGGSSMIPAVQDILVDKFGSNRVASHSLTTDPVISEYKGNYAKESEVLTSIVRGLAMVGCREKSLIDDIVDSDYGVWDAVNNDFIQIIQRGTYVKQTKLDKISKQGIFEDVQCIDENVSTVNVEVYQNNITGLHKLGTINIPNPGGKKYRIYMQVDKKKGTLEVTIYDTVKQRWIEEIPLNERLYTLK